MNDTELYRQILGIECPWQRVRKRSNRRKTSGIKERKKKGRLLS
jgi:hypothetical protein